MLRIAQLLLPCALGGATAQAAEFWIAEGDEVFGAVQVIEARYEDTFVSLARAYNVGYEELRQANPGVDAWLPGTGTKITIPTQYVLPRAPQRGLVVNIAELRLYYFPAESGTPPEGVAPGSRRVITHPISIGRMDWSTPLGSTTITTKVANPSWYPPQSIRDEHAARGDFLARVVPPGPDNPLGKHAMRLGLPGSYLIHGTNRPSGVGMRVTHGCVRMFPEDIEALYKTVPVGTAVNIVNQPVKIGWTTDGTLYLESHPALMESNVDGENVTTADASAEIIEPTQESPLTSLMRAYIAATEERRVELDWDAAERVAQFGNGVPEAVSVAGSVVPLVSEIAAVAPEDGD